VATSLFLLFQLASQLILEHRKAQLFNRNVLQLLLVPQLRTRSFHRLSHTIQSLHFVSYVYAPYPSYPPSYMPAFLPVVSPPSASYRPPAAAPDRHLLLCSSPGISQSVPVTLTTSLNLQWLLTMYALGTQNGKHLHLVEHINQNLLLLTTM